MAVRRDFDGPSSGGYAIKASLADLWLAGRWLALLTRPPLRFAAQTTSPPFHGGEETQLERRRHRGSGSSRPQSGGEVSRRSRDGEGVLSSAQASPSPRPLSRLTIEWSPSTGSGVGSGAWDRAVSNLYEARSPRRRRCSCPTAGSAAFTPRTSLASVRARTYGHPRPSSATVSAADPAPSSSLIPGAHQVPVRAMQPLCGRDGGVWIKEKQRLLIDVDNVLPCAPANPHEGGQQSFHIWKSHFWLCRLMSKWQRVKSLPLE
ncbi:hypothetical protein SAMN04488498_102175 [Mesorhizobium albiziae]|uniref:Uncharacterized protein n=1 Tax=Neomesorhizobium albiziae TaxID=335020 RepID=A0A1I3WFY7_9HYPH|nr:hypothetical protein SAMN04488498_102175 [Mesorhizobium albiziae]